MHRFAEGRDHEALCISRGFYDSISAATMIDRTVESRVLKRRDCCELVTCARRRTTLLHLASYKTRGDTRSMLLIDSENHRWMVLDVKRSSIVDKRLIEFFICRFFHLFFLDDDNDDDDERLWGVRNSGMITRNYQLLPDPSVFPRLGLITFKIGQHRRQMASRFKPTLS